VTQSGPSELDHAIQGLRTWMESRHFEGYEPFDLLNSPYLSGTWARQLPPAILLIQFGKRFAGRRLRQLLKVPQSRNPKALGLCLSAYCDLARSGCDVSAEAAWLKGELIRLRSPHESYFSWGYDWDYLSLRGSRLPAFSPNCIASYFCGTAMLEMSQVFGDQEALEIAEQFGFPVRVIKTEEMGDANYTSNPSNRCYFCKSELFECLAEIAKRESWQTIVYGENASDGGDYRPGTVAAKEYQVRAPLKEVGLTKAEIRELSAELGLPTADKPAMACLSSRIPYGEPVTEEALGMIEAAENVLRDAGFYEVRVRHHGTENSKSEIRNSKLYLARIEIGPEEFQKIFKEEVRGLVAQALKKIGYAYVTLDLQGYRRGSANEVLVKLKEE